MLKQLEIKEEEFKDRYILKLSGEIDVDGSEKLEEVATKILKLGKKFLVIDFEEVSYIYSVAVAVLLEINKMTKENNVKLLLIRLSQQNENIFKMTGTHLVLKIIHSKEELDKFTQ